MNSILSPGEISPGMIITVFEWTRQRSSSPVNNMIEMLEKHLGESWKNKDVKCGNDVKYKDYSYVGDPLCVVAVKLPFVRVLILPNKLRAITLDTRQCILMELPEEFAMNGTSFKDNPYPDVDDNLKEKDKK